MRADGMGANVIICEVDPLKALEAVMDGYRVMPSIEAAKVGDIWITVTGDMHVIGREHFEVMKDGAIICNSGHFNVEIDIPRAARDGRLRARGAPARRGVHDAPTAATIYLLADGRLVNLSCAEGHPASVMDMSFANQALCAEYMVEERRRASSPASTTCPWRSTPSIAELKLATMGVEIDTLTEEQEKYLRSAGKRAPSRFDATARARRPAARTIW